MSSLTINSCLLIFFLVPEKRERRKRYFGALGSVASPPPPLIHGRKRWDPFQGRELGFMMVEEFVTYRVPEDPVSPMPVEGSMVSLVACYE
jgi:hypothetical protein